MMETREEKRKSSAIEAIQIRIVRIVVLGFGLGRKGLCIVAIAERERVIVLIGWLPVEVCSWRRDQISQRNKTGKEKMKLKSMVTKGMALCS